MTRILILTCLVALASCGPLQRETLTLQPSFFALHETSFGRNTGPSDLFLDREGIPNSPEITQWRGSDQSDTAVPMGFSTDVLRRPQPLPNDYWYWNVWQAKMFFSLDSLPDGAVVEQARLRFSATGVDTDIRRFPVREGVTNGCNLRVGSARAPLTTGESRSFGRDAVLKDLATRPQSGARTGAISLDVTGTVLRWQTGSRDNNGFLITPVDPAILTENDNKYCMRYISRPRLDLVIVRRVPE